MAFNKKIGVFGYGSIGKRHVSNIQGLRYNKTYWHDPIQYFPFSIGRERLLKECDAIVVASPSIEHTKDLMDAIHAGNHVLVEKPFGYDCPPLLDSFMQGARSKNPELIVATGFNLRFHHCVQKAKSVMDSGILGEPIAASFVVNQKTEKEVHLRDGVIRNWLSHEIDLAHYLLGNGTVTACSGDDTQEAFIEMKFPAVKEKVFISGDYYTDPEQRYFWIEGTKANLYVNLILRECYLKENGNAPRLLFQATDTFDSNYIEEMATFIASIEQGQHLAPLATAEDGIRALYTVMDAYSMMQSGKILERPTLGMK